MVFPAGGNLEINTVTTFFEFGTRQGNLPSTKYKTIWIFNC